jgi:S-adenosylmethionine-diacylglycerol 3-amino-3-carboxypropyl transferase
MMHRERTTTIEERTSFQELRYASCWEDATVVARALEPLDGARCLSIASAGDNTLSLVARGARDSLGGAGNPASTAIGSA